MTVSPRELNIPETVIEAQRWIAGRIKEAKADGVVIGLSGGVDSAVVAALCVGAVGTGSVHGMILPCESQTADIDDAQIVANHLGIYYEVVDLTQAYVALTTAIKDIDHKMARANIKSRLRMTALYARANQKNCLVCGTTNLTELYLGYYTKYGDGGVDIEPIDGLLKRDVRAIAAYKRFPDTIVHRTPSAGLWPGQTDEGELGRTYDRLDDAVLTLESGRFDTSVATQDDVEFVKGRFDASAHKRHPPRGGAPRVFEE